MTVDLLKLQAGDTVLFRCGGSEVVKHIYQAKLIEKEPYMITYQGYENTTYEYDEGSFDSLSEETPFDIIKVTPAPFD